jgi:ubiquinone biosynthesis protein
MSETPARHSHRARYSQIVAILGRRGLGALTQPQARPEHMRAAFEELGPTFIKIGQILSTRADLLPPDYVAELTKLQDHAPPVPIDAIQDVIEAELGRPLEQSFATFDLEPLAAASIGQAHTACLADGTQVVVKVRRPGVVEQVQEDLEILQSLAILASRHWRLAERYDLIGLAQEFAQTLRAELDYIREGRNATRFAENFAGDRDLHIPQVFWELTTPRVLTLERIRGIKINDLGALDAAGVDRAALAKRATRVLLQMVFEDGFFHADPHPGNFFVEADGRIGLIDFGMVGSVDDRTRDQLASLLLAITEQDADRLVDAFLELGFARKRIDRVALRRDLEHLMARYYGEPLGRIRLGALIEEALDVVRRHALQLPVNLALLLKTAVMDEGLGAQLDPEFRLTNVIVPFAERLVLRQYSPFRWVGRVRQAGLDAARLGADMPQQLRRLMLDLERGGLEVGMRPTGFEPLMQRFERMVNRVVLGVLASAFIIGLSGLISAYHVSGWEQVADVLLGTGLVIALVLGAYLAVTIFRTGRL